MKIIEKLIIIFFVLIIFTACSGSKEEGTSFAGIWLYKTRCQHGIRSKAEPIFNSFGMRYASMGVVFKHPDEKTVYVAGDTIWCDEVKKTIDTYEPEYIIINC